MPRKKSPSAIVTTRTEKPDHVVTLGTAGRFVIPQTVREELNLNEGDAVRVRIRNGRIVISTGRADLANAQDVLKAASEKSR